MADRVAVMIAGRIRRSGTPYEVYAVPADARVARLLGQTNFLRARVAGGVATTALGRLPVPDTYNGPADVLVKPEALHATPDLAGAACVVRVEFYGHDQLVRCVLEDGSELDVRLMGPRPELEVGTSVRLEVTGTAQAFPSEVVHALGEAGSSLGRRGPRRARSQPRGGGEEPLRVCSYRTREVRLVTCGHKGHRPTVTTSCSEVDHVHVESAGTRRIVDGEHGPTARPLADAPASMNLGHVAMCAGQRAEPQPAPADGQILGVDDEARNVSEEGPADSEKSLLLDACPHRIVKISPVTAGTSLANRASLAISVPWVITTIAGTVLAVAQPELYIMEGRKRLFEVEGVGPTTQRGHIAGQRDLDSWIHDRGTSSPTAALTDQGAVAQSRVEADVAIRCPGEASAGARVPMLAVDREHRGAVRVDDGAQCAAGVAKGIRRRASAGRWRVQAGRVPVSRHHPHHLPRLANRGESTFSPKRSIYALTVLSYSRLTG